MVAHRRQPARKLASLLAIVAEQEATIQQLRTQLSVAKSYMHARRAALRRKSHA